MIHIQDENEGPNTLWVIAEENWVNKARIVQTQDEAADVALAIHEGKENDVFVFKLNKSDLSRPTKRIREEIAKIKNGEYRTISYDEFSDRRREETCKKNKIWVKAYEARKRGRGSK